MYFTFSKDLSTKYPHTDMKLNGIDTKCVTQYMNKLKSIRYALWIIIKCPTLMAFILLMEAYIGKNRFI